MNTSTLRTIQSGFVCSLLGMILLVSSAWLGPVFGAVGFILSIVSFKQAREQGGQAFLMVVMGLVFGGLDLALLWIAPGLFHAIWG